MKPTVPRYPSPAQPGRPVAGAYLAAVTVAVLALLLWGGVRDAEWRLLFHAGQVRWERLARWLWFMPAAWVYTALVCALPYAGAMAVAERCAIRHPAYYVGGAMAAALLGDAGLWFLRSIPNDDPTGYVPTLLEWTWKAAPMALFAGAWAGLVAWRVLFPRPQGSAEPV